MSNSKDNRTSDRGSHTPRGEETAPRSPAAAGPWERASRAVAEIFAVAAIEQVSIERILVAKKQLRKHTPQQIDMLAGAFEVLGIIKPLVIDELGQLLAGHACLAAAKKLGMTEVPVVRIRHWTPELKRMFVLADNQIADLACWDDAALALELKDLSALDLNLEIVGFDGVELDIRLGKEPDPFKAHSQDPDDEHPEPSQGPAVSRPGDIWELDKHAVLCADFLSASADLDRLLEGAEIAQVATDPPYNVRIKNHVSGARGFREFAEASGEKSFPEFVDFLVRAMEECRRRSRDGAIFHVFMSHHGMYALLAAGCKAGLELKNICVWVKPSAGMGSFYRSQHEFAVVLKSGTGPHINNVRLGARGRNRSNVWRYPGVRGARTGASAPDGGHPTVKPALMMADLIKDCSNRGDIVFDPFGGSGTTLIAAERAGRRARLVEIDPLYVDLIVRRWLAVMGQPAILRGDGRTFEQVARARQTIAEPGEVTHELG